MVTSSDEKGREWSKKFGVPAEGIYNFDNFDSIADNPDIDGVFIVLPNAQHAEYSIRSAKAGKHVLCEKPLANTVDECEQMIAACMEADRLLATAYRCLCAAASRTDQPG